MLEKGKLISNSLSILINRLTQSITTFVLTAAIARILGSEALGQYLLAFSYYFIFVSIASQGLKTLFTRELARNPEKTPIFLTNGTWLQLLLSLVSYGALVLLVFLLPYTTETSNVCYIMGLTIIPFSLSNITEAIFQAQEKMYLIAISTVPVYILRLLVMIWAMQMSYGVEAITKIFIVSESIILIAQWLLLVRIVKIKWKIDQDFIWDSFKAARTFFAIEGIAVVHNRFQILILSLIGNEALVGIYGGITQLIQPFLIIANSIATAIFPSLSKSVTQGIEYQQKITKNLIEILLIFACPLIIGCLFFSKDLLVFIYNPSFAQANVYLNIISFALFFLSFNRAIPFVLLANGYENLNLRILIINSTLGSLAGIVLVSQFKLMGAVITDLLTTILIAGYNMYYLYGRLFSLNLIQMMRRPGIISLLLIPILIILQISNLNFLTKLIISSCCYISIVSFFLLQSLDGFHTRWLKKIKKV
jgi:O-antigen/teichoic acid export membrane protein